MSTNLVVPGLGIRASATASGVSTSLIELVDVKTGLRSRGVVDQPWIGGMLGPAAGRYMLRPLPTHLGRKAKVGVPRQEAPRSVGSVCQQPLEWLIDTCLTPSTLTHSRAGQARRLCDWGLQKSQATGVCSSERKSCYPLEPLPSYNKMSFQKLNSVPSYISAYQTKPQFRTLGLFLLSSYC